MVVGALRLTFVVPPVDGSSKGEAQKIKDRLWSKFKVAVAELPVDSSEQVVIGVALVGGDEKTTRERADAIIRHLQEWGSVDLVNDESDFVRFEDIELERDFAKYNP
jgi:uncharacterized protein YlxP (DUF503 family)